MVSKKFIGIIGVIILMAILIFAGIKYYPEKQDFSVKPFSIQLSMLLS